MTQVSAYLAGNIQKGHEKESEIFWSKDDVEELKQKIAPHEIVFLNPAKRTDDLSDQMSVFGRDMTQVFVSDLILVDVRERRGLGVGAEMMWAKSNGIYVVTLCPRNSHYHRDPCILLGQTVHNWTHPFVESLSDVIVEDVDEMSAAITEFILERPKAKDLSSVHRAMKHYQRDQLNQDVPMREIFQQHPFIEERLSYVEEVAAN